jgi:hypothetical protein
MSFETFTFGSHAGMGAPPTMPTGRDLTPEWVDANCDVKHMRIPWTSRPARADAALLRHVHKLQGGDTNTIPSVEKSRRVWKNDFHSFAGVSHPGTGFLKSMVQPTTLLQFDPYAAIHVKDYLNMIAQTPRFAEEVAAGTIRAYYCPDCLNYETLEETKEAIKMWWVGGDGSIGAKEVLYESICNGFISFEAGVLGGVYYEGPLRGGYGMVASHCCVTVFPLIDYHGAYTKCMLSGIRDPAYVDFDGQSITSDGSALLLAVDCQSEQISFQNYNTGRVAQVADVCTGIMKATLKANWAPPTATSARTTDQPPSAAATAAASRLHREVYEAHLAASGAEARARDLARKARTKQSRASALRVRNTPPKDVVPGPSHKPPTTRKGPKSRTVVEELVHQRWVSDEEREARRVYADATKEAKHAQALANKAERVAAQLCEAVAAISKKHAAATHRVPALPNVSEFVEKSLGTVAIE